MLKDPSGEHLLWKQISLQIPLIFFPLKFERNSKEMQFCRCTKPTKPFTPTTITNRFFLNPLNRLTHTLGWQWQLSVVIISNVRHCRHCCEYHWTEHTCALLSLKNKIDASSLISVIKHFFGVHFILSLSYIVSKFIS